MAGHSKWANIKHKKAHSDAIKGRVFSKIAKEIVVTARAGGGDPSSNITLRTVLQKARAANMTNENIDRAIKRGTGETTGAAMEEMLYEGYAPGGVALVVQTLSDNRNRTAPEIRNVFSKFGGNLATQGAVTRGFKRKGQIIISAEAVEEDRLLEIALEAGAEDIQRQGEVYEVLTELGQYLAVADALTKAGLKAESSEITMIPDLQVPVNDKNQAAALLKFVEALENLEDVQNVYANFDIPDDIMAAVS